MPKKSQIKFLLYFGVIFFVTFILLYSAGLIPESIKPNEGDSFRTLWDKAQNNVVDKQVNQGLVIAESPTRIVIDKIGIDAIISNPNTTNATTLDDYLKEGAVRYPGSGSLGVGNMFLFGHSTGLVVVHNQAYKTFNGLKNLVSGDTIKVYGSSGIYLYRVSSVRLVDSSEIWVKFNNTKNMLTLSTCNVFGAKEERYVVEADYIGNI